MMLHKYHILFAGSAADGRLDCFHFLAVVDGAAMSILIQAPVWLYFHFAWVYAVKEKTTGLRRCHSCSKPMIPNLDLIPDLIAISASPGNITQSTSLEFSGHLGLSVPHKRKKRKSAG